jgi:GTP-binding protein HflX
VRASCSSSRPWTGGDGVIPTFQRKKRKIDQKDEAPDDSAEAAEDGDEEDEVEDAASTFGGPTPAEKATVVLVDHDLSPSQARNLERATGAEVLDRTAVILSIFQRHARTREARLQVEIARLAYQAPRLRETGGGGDRQRGGIGGKGAGESNLELDRRKIRDRIAELREELASIEQEAGVRRKRRSEAATVALVGYTNAGKIVVDARADGRRGVRRGQALRDARHHRARARARDAAAHPRLRHGRLHQKAAARSRRLVPLHARRGARGALLLHVLDAADPAFRAQFEVTRTVLRELEADDAPSLVILNKIDKVSEEDRQALAVEFPDALQVSSRSAEDKALVHGAIVSFFEKDMIEARFVIPYDRQAMTSRLHEETRVLSEEYEEEGAILRVRAMPGVIAKLEKELASPERAQGRGR